MCEGNVYRVSSSVRVQQVEAELRHQLEALRREIEEGASTSYSSVLPPKDISVFRAEREQTLRRALQVSEARPAASHADTMHRELQSCLSAEHSAGALPPLLRQFYADRSYHLAQIKYLLMLRWRRFCRHADVTRRLYPDYKHQMSLLTNEFEDAVQRARRLSASQEALLAGRGGAVGPVTEGDVVIYLRWLICHLRSAQTLRNFLGVLRYLPACERRSHDEEETPPLSLRDDGEHHRNKCVCLLADSAPPLTDQLQDFLPQLKSLMTCFRLSHDAAANLKDAADEMQLFSLVWREFRSVFGQQEQKRTFPAYHGSEARDDHWGRRSGSTALMKEAHWIPFIQVKPERDLSQQTFLAKMKGKKRVDELLKMHSSFLQASDLVHVAAMLKNQAFHVGDSATARFLSHGGESKHQKISEIWSSVYDSAALTQKASVHSSRDGHRVGSQMSSTRHQRASLDSSLQLRRVMDSPEAAVASHPGSAGGARLSLTCLRHLRLRELQRLSLGMLNYLRSVEKTLTFDLAGVQQAEDDSCSMGWMNAASGGQGQTEGFNHSTPGDHKVHCSEFMKFEEVENLHDFYSVEEGCIHTQDQRGLYVVYDAAVRDLQQLEEELLLVGSYFIHRRGMKNPEAAETDVDRVAVLLDLWTCETEFLESKVQLLNCYLEAYHHATAAQEKLALAQVITDIAHSRPNLDHTHQYFVRAYRADIHCLQMHQQLITELLANQIESQRQYLRHIWRGGGDGGGGGGSGSHHFGLPPRYVPKHLVSLSVGSPAPLSVFLLEVHPFLGLASTVYRALHEAHVQLCQLRRAVSAADRLALRQKLLRSALQSWSGLASPGASYSSQVQRDLFSGGFIEDPILVEKLGLSMVRSAGEKDQERVAVETFSKLLEVVTIRHRLLESATETAHLAQLYKNVASELGFEEFHLYLRPVELEFAEQRPVFITAFLEDSGSADRFVAPHMPLSIQELDNNQIGRFSFSSEESVFHLMSSQKLEDLRVALACQVTQKNALFSAVTLASVCYWSAQHRGDLVINPKIEKSDGDLQGKRPSRGSSRPPATAKKRLTEAFVSIQLEKVELRDEMLNSFARRKQAVGGLIKTPDEAAETRRSLIIDFLQKFNTRVSEYSVRAQIVAYLCSLSWVLDSVPSVRRAYFTFSGQREPPDSDAGGRSLLSADGQSLVNLWHIPHHSEVLQMFRALEASAAATALHNMLRIVSALHDIVCYLVGFSRLGNTEDPCEPGPRGAPPGQRLAADWGGAEGIGSELQELARQVASLPDAGAAATSVSRLLRLRRQVLLLQFDVAIRQLREAFLSSGDSASCRIVTDNMAAALPGLSGVARPDVFTLTLPVPAPLYSKGHQAEKMYPWRSFLCYYGLKPLHVWDVSCVEHWMQLCVSGLSEHGRQQVNAAVLGASLLGEDLLSSGEVAAPLRLHGNEGAEGGHSWYREGEETGPESSDSAEDPIRIQKARRGFLLLTKQLQVLKEGWAHRRLGQEAFREPKTYGDFLKAYRAEILIPSSRSCMRLPSAGALEANAKVWQLRRLLEISECHMIRATQARLSTEAALAVAERTRQGSTLPTDLWRKCSLKVSVAPERPQLVESFIQQLMSGAEETEGQLSFSSDHLRQCLTRLGCSVMERERRGFLHYANFYEQMLQHQIQLLQQREQELKKQDDDQSSTQHREVSAVCRRMVVQISALQAQVAQLEEEKKTLEEKLCLKITERYEPLVRHLFTSCIQLRAELKQRHLQVQQEVSEVVSDVRREAVEKIIQLRMKLGSSSDTEPLLLSQEKREEVQELQLENSRLLAAICKLKTLRCWREVVEEGKLRQRLLQFQQRELCSRIEALWVKMTSEEELLSLGAELQVAQQALSCSQSECSRAKRLLDTKSKELQALRLRSASEAASRQQLEAQREHILEQTRTVAEERDQRLRELTRELERGGRMQQLQRRRSATQIQQAKRGLQQERSLKLQAFQRLQQLQKQQSHTEAPSSRNTSGGSRQMSSLQFADLRKDGRRLKTVFTLSASSRVCPTETTFPDL